MRYWNDLVRVGLAISAISILALFSMMFFRARVDQSPSHQLAYEEPIHVEAGGPKERDV